MWPTIRQCRVPIPELLHAAGSSRRDWTGGDDVSLGCDLSGYFADRGRPRANQRFGTRQAVVADLLCAIFPGLPGAGRLCLSGQLGGLSQRAYACVGGGECVAEKHFAALSVTALEY